MTRARREIVDLETTPYYHCICRCVRRAFLCGQDNFSGQNYAHRRLWVLERLKTLESIFSIDICAYAIMSNHYHLVLRVSRHEALQWSEQEVIGRWGKLFSLPLLVDSYQAGRNMTHDQRKKAKAIIALWRERLSDLSWFMRSLNEELARRANAEDGCKGRFWEGRFKSQALLDEAAVLTCMSYVDLNPVRAGMADTPETSDFTSIQQRVREVSKRKTKKQTQDKPSLVPLKSQKQTHHPNAFVFTIKDYLELVDWSGRAIREGKRGAISTNHPPILQRLKLDPARFIQQMQKGGQDYHIAALGHVVRLREAAERLGRRFLKGHSQSRRLYLLGA